MSRWDTGADVVLQVVGKYLILGTVVEPEWEDGRVKVQWEDRTTTIIRGDLLVTPGAAAIRTLADDVDATLDEVRRLREVVDGSDHYAAKYWREKAVALVERDGARDLAAHLEAEVARDAAAFQKILHILALSGTDLNSTNKILDVLDEHFAGVTS